MTIKDAFHHFIEEHWDEFMKKHALTDVGERDELPGPPPLPEIPPLNRPTADNDMKIPAGPSVPVLEQIEEDPLEEVVKDDTLLAPKARAVRTPLSGDKVYLLDELSKTKKWVRSPEQLEAAGFTLGDVQKIEDTELAQYKLSL